MLPGFIDKISIGLRLCFPSAAKPGSIPGNCSQIENLIGKGRHERDIGYLRWYKKSMRHFERDRREVSKEPPLICSGKFPAHDHGMGSDEKVGERH